MLFDVVHEHALLVQELEALRVQANRVQHAAELDAPYHDPITAEDVRHTIAGLKAALDRAERLRQHVEGPSRCSR
jgi:ABC-type phosphate transport system auxiliary subunit